MINKLGIGCLAIVLLVVFLGILVVIDSGAGGSDTGSGAVGRRSAGNAEQPLEEPHAAQGRDIDAIPGLMPVDVYGNFDGQRGFVLVDRSSMPDGSMYWKCKEDGRGRYDRDVEVYSTPGNASAVMSIRGTSAAYSTDPDDTAREFLGFLATITYDNASPTEAKAWVEKNIGTAGWTVIGGVKFELFTGGSSRMLRITVGPNQE